jgi:hypothetical protein
VVGVVGVAAVVTAAERVAGAEVDIEGHQVEGRLVAGCCGWVVEVAGSVAYKENDVSVDPEEAAEAAPVAADCPSVLVRMRRGRCKLMEGLPRRQPGDCCGGYWGLGKMQQR